MNEVHSIDQGVIQKLREIVIANLHNEHFGVKELSFASGMSRSTVHRKLKYNLNKSVSQFIREIRLEQAMEILRNSSETVSEIAYKVGFNSPTYFNSSFHHHFGFPPGEVKKRWHLDDCDQIIQPKQGKDQKPFMGSKVMTRHKLFLVHVLFLSIISSIILAYFFLERFSENHDLEDFPRLKNKNKSIAVLPFKSLSLNPENQYFADGIMEGLINRLCKVQELKVISRASVERFRATTLSARGIAKKLNVQYILEGSVQRDKDKVKIAIQLTDARHDRLIWSQEFDKQILDIFIVQSIIIQKIVAELNTVLSNKEIERIERIPTKDTVAYTSYLKGRFFWNRRTQKDLEKSKDYFEKALAADPEFANAHNGLADNYFIQAWWGWIDRNEGFTQAKQYAQQALSIDQNLAEAHATLGGILCWADWNWKEAEKELNIAIELNPQYSTAYQYYSELLNILGRKEEALELINTALEFNPFSLVMNDIKSHYLFDERKYEEAMKNCNQLEEFEPDYKSNHWRKFYIYFRQEKNLEALKSLQKINTLDSMTIDASNMVEKIYLKSGMNGVLNWLIELEVVKPNPNYVFIARLYILSGNKEESLKWLEKALKVKSPALPRINSDSDFESLRTNPNFRKLISEMGLKQKM